MKGYMGSFGETSLSIPGTVPAPKNNDVPLMLQPPKTTDQVAKEQMTLFATASGIASKNVSETLEKAAALAKSKDIQDFIEANNLGPYLKDVNQERVKAILILLGVWQLTSWLKSKPGLILLGSLGGWFIYTKATNKTKKVADKVAIAAVKAEPPKTVVLTSTGKV